mmetsp:Transcript_782/g.1496  ORF Transcript_782/g.1496 Transcript_782/m.1496 type:complete len:216 (+) Transcript_782:27-674(+)
MGNTLLTTHKIACGHTDRAHLWQSLLCDRLSKPTAEMVDALLYLQDHLEELQKLCSMLTSDQSVRPTVSMELVASCCCMLFEYSPTRREGDEASGVQMVFAGVLQQPQEFLQDLLALRSQAVAKEKISQLQFLIQEVDFEACRKENEAMEKVAMFVKAAVDSAQIYSEIRDAAQAGRIDRHQATKLLDSPESDQRRMMNAMHTGRPEGASGHKEP